MQTSIFYKEIRWFANKLLWEALVPAASSAKPDFGDLGGISGILRAWKTGLRKRKALLSP